MLAAAPASAAPELFVRMQTWDTHEPASDWIPLASAPTLNYLGGYEIGYRLEVSGFQRAALTVTGVPDGVPTQPANSPPFCVGRNGAAGDIVAAGAELHFEGSGTYSVAVAVAATGDCLAQAPSTGSFTVTGQVAPSLVGTPLSFRAAPLPGDPFVGVQAPAPPGGEADVRCARDAVVQTDGSVTGTMVVPEADLVPKATVEESHFPRPGAWTCVARGSAEGQDDGFRTVMYGTPWSSPIAFEVRSDFRRRTGRLARLRAKRPRFTFTAEWPAEANGGRATVKLLRVAGCRGRKYRLRAAATYRGRFGAKRLRLSIRRPRAGFYLGRFSFSGTRYLRPSVDPNPMYLLARHDRLEYVPPNAFPPCPGYRP
jgi:hypothetical protein